MKVTYDKQADAMYIYLEKPKPGCAKQTIALNGNMIVDLDEDQKIIGIEILGASKNLNKEGLKQAEKAVA